MLKYLNNRSDDELIRNTLKKVSIKLNNNHQEIKFILTDTPGAAA